MRLEKTESAVRRKFNPAAVSLGGSGFSLVELTNEPAAGYWNADGSSGENPAGALQDRVRGVHVLRAVRSRPAGR
jgi:hypothetical protein